MKWSDGETSLEDGKRRDINTRPEARIRKTQTSIHIHRSSQALQKPLLQSSQICGEPSRRYVIMCFQVQENIGPRAVNCNVSWVGRRTVSQGTSSYRSSVFQRLSIDQGTWITCEDKRSHSSPSSTGLSTCPVWLWEERDSIKQDVLRVVLRVEVLRSGEDCACIYHYQYILHMYVASLYNLSMMEK